MSGSIEVGACDICKETTQVTRRYYNYDICCECHSPNHFELVKYCNKCTPVEPTVTTVKLSTSNLAPVKLLEETIIVTSKSDPFNDPKIFTVRGDTEKELIYEIYGSLYSPYLEDEDDIISNDIADGILNKQEILAKIKFDTLEEFLIHLNSSQFYFRTEN